MVSALICRSKGLDLDPGLSVAVFLGKTPYSHIASLHLGVYLEVTLMENEHV